MIITEIPACPDSISTAEARELFMDLCQDLIRQKRLTAEMLESVKGYCFTHQIGNMAQKQLLKDIDSMEWHELWMMCTTRELECSAVIGLTPVDRKNLGLL